MNEGDFASDAWNRVMDVAMFDPADGFNPVQSRLGRTQGLKAFSRSNYPFKSPHQGRVRNRGFQIATHVK